MNITISPCITFQRIFKLRWGFVCILLDTNYFLILLKYFLLQPRGGGGGGGHHLQRLRGGPTILNPIFQSYCAL